MKDSSIEWTHHTFNPWWGCTKVSAGCTNCYAEATANRWGHNVWGPNSNRRWLSDAQWQQPIKWNSAAARTGNRQRVFCASMADVFENREDLELQRQRLWQLILDTPYLDWLLLTKRPQHIRELLPNSLVGHHNVWLGTTVENQETAEERPALLLETPAAVHFLSCEPLLSAVDLSPHLPACNWVIVGSESGNGARPMQVSWASSIVQQCTDAEVACFTKQIATPQGRQAGDWKGTDPNYWPNGNWPRDWPVPRTNLQLCA